MENELKELKRTEMEALRLEQHAKAAAAAAAAASAGTASAAIAGVASGPRYDATSTSRYEPSSMNSTPRHEQVPTQHPRGKHDFSNAFIASAYDQMESLRKEWIKQ